MFFRWLTLLKSATVVWQSASTAESGEKRLPSENSPAGLVQRGDDWPATQRFPTAPASVGLVPAERATGELPALPDKTRKSPLATAAERSAFSAERRVNEAESIRT